MRLQNVLFRVDATTQLIGCLKVTADSGEFAYFWDGRLHQSLLPIWEKRLWQANLEFQSYKRECWGRRCAVENARFWERMIAGGEGVGIVLEDV